jgi:hypothetical protein
MTNRWLAWTWLGLALTVSTSAGLACDQKAKESAAATDTTAAATKAPEAGCDMPCCAHAKQAADAKSVAQAPPGKPCAGIGAKGCPKRSAAASATAVVAKEAPAEPVVEEKAASDPGTNR